MLLKSFLRQVKAKKRAKNTMISLEQTLVKTQDQLGKPLEELDWEELFSHIEKLKLSDSTLALLESKLIQFYKFCFDETDDVRYNKMVKKLKGIKINNHRAHISPQDLLLPEDVKKLINVATLERDRCLVASFFESGMRKGEMILIPNSKVIMDEQKQEVIFEIPDVEGCKTGGRTVMCTEIYGYVQDWMKCNDSKMFMPMSPSGVGRIIERLYEKANLKKPCNVHMFRHSAITHWVNIGMQPNAISMRAWGIPNSNMLTTYISLSEQMQATAYKNAKGLNGDGTKIINPLASRCVECGKLIQSGNLCKQCEQIKELKGKLKEMDDLKARFEEFIEVKADNSDSLECQWKSKGKNRTA